MTLTKHPIQQLVSEHDAWRKTCMNLIASENAISPAVQSVLYGDLVQRYGNYLGRDLSERRYTGNSYIKSIEAELETIVKTVFDVSDVELRAISGHVAGLAVIMATCQPGDTVVELTGEAGGHRLAAKANESPLIDLDVMPLPFDAEAYNVDVAATCELIREHQPRLVILGSSNFLFPHPVREIAACLQDSPRTILAYDASHVFGLIACGAFQKPIDEGAHIAFGSTHKTLPGPQGGLIIGNDKTLMDAVGIAVYPGIVTNHHLMRSPALGIALQELSNNPDYAAQIVRNARTLATRLTERGINVVGRENRFTESHTILLAVTEFGDGKEVAKRLEAADIMASYSSLPSQYGKACVRMGTSEVTRLGAQEADLIDAADIIADVILGRLAVEAAQEKVHAWAKRLNAIRYTEL